MSNKFTEKTYEEPKKFTYIVKTGDPKSLLNVRSTPEVRPSNVIGSLHTAFVMTSKLE